MYGFINLQRIVEQSIIAFITQGQTTVDVDLSMRVREGAGEGCSLHKNVQCKLMDINQREGKHRGAVCVLFSLTKVSLILLCGFVQ